MALIKWTGRESESLGARLRLVGRFNLYIGEPVKSKCGTNHLRLWFFTLRHLPFSFLHYRHQLPCWERYTLTPIIQDQRFSH